MSVTYSSSPLSTTTSAPPPKHPKPHPTQTFFLPLSSQTLSSFHKPLPPPTTTPPENPQQTPPNSLCLVPHKAKGAKLFSKQPSHHHITQQPALFGGVAVETQPPKHPLRTLQCTIRPHRNVHDGAAVENTTAAPKDLLPSAALMHRHQCGGVQTNFERHHGSVGGGGDTGTS